MINLNPVKAVVFQGPRRGRGRPKLGHVLFAHRVTKEKVVELEACLRGDSELQRAQAEIKRLKNENYELVAKLYGSAGAPTAPVQTIHTSPIGSGEARMSPIDTSGLVGL